MVIPLDPTPRPKESLRGTIQDILPFAAGGRRSFILLAVSSSISGALEATVLVLVTRLAVGLGPDQDDVPTIPLLGEWSRGSVVLLALGLLLVKVLLQLVAAYQGSSLATRSLSQARTGLMEDFLAASWPEQTRNRLGVLQELMTTHVDRVAGILLTSSVGLVAFVNVLALLVAAVLVSPIAATGILITGIVLNLVMRPITTSARRTAARQVEWNKRYAASVTETVGMAREVRVMNAEEPVKARLSVLQWKSAEPYRKSRYLSSFAPNLYQSLAIGVVLVGLGLASTDGPANLASLGAVVLLLLRALAFAQQAQNSYQQVQQAAPYLVDLRAEQLHYKLAAVDPGGRELDHVGEVRFDAVTFSYVPDRRALDDLDLVIAPGESIGIVGPSGSGKSTIVQLLLRLRTPDAGRILTEGQPADEVSLRSWYEHVAYVPQEPHLFEGTVADNIDFFRGHERSTVEEAARQAHIDAEIRELPGGFDAMLGENGSGLSGGQRQRVCIARALLGHPDLIVLDEPTSALDLASEAGISQTLQALHGRTSLVIVAHRLSTLSHCDRVLVMMDGRRTAFGPHAELMASSAFYREAISLAGVVQ